MPATRWPGGGGGGVTTVVSVAMSESRMSQPRPPVEKERWEN